MKASWGRAGFTAALACALCIDGEAAILTVGPGGAFPTVQSAFEIAATLGGVNDVRIRNGTFFENVDVTSCCAGILRVSGGWNGGFSTRVLDPMATTIDGRGLGRAMQVETIDSGRLLLENLTLRNGRLTLTAAARSGWGAGFRSSIQETGELNLRGIYFRANVIRTDAPEPTEGHGAGAFLLVGSPRVFVDGCRFESNGLYGPAGTSLRAFGGGLEVQAFEGGKAAIRSTTFRGNRAAGSESATGGGISVLVQYTPEQAVTLEDLVFEQNAADAGSGSAADLWAGDGMGSVNILMRRCWIRKNGLASQQLRVHAEDGARIDVSDTELWGGDKGGVTATARAGGHANLTNLTVADNAWRGLEAQSSAANISVINSIAYGNGGGGNLFTFGPVFTNANLIGVDPLFVNRPGHDYRLRAESPARDAGSNGPVAGLGPLDLRRGPRVVGGIVDIGADEIAP